VHASAVRTALVTFLALLPALLLAPPAAAARWVVENGGRQIEIDARRSGQVDYLAADDLAEAFGGTLAADPGTGGFVLTISGLALRISSREAIVTVEGRVVTLPYPSEVDRKGRLWVTSQFVERALSPIYPSSIEREGTRFRVRGASAIGVTARSSHDAAGTRVVLEFSRKVRYEYSDADGAARVRVLDGPLEPRAFPYTLTGEEVMRVAFEPGTSGTGTFTLVPGPAYGAVRTSQLEAPFRIVLDVAKAGGTKLAAAAVPLPVAGAPRGTGARGIKRIVVDPGHGGTEVGAAGPTGLFEKDVVLDIATRVALLLRQRLGVEVLLTRESDLQVGLDDRAALANERKGDLFVSIHANASRGPRAAGAETYFLAPRPSDEQSESLAAAENLEGAAGAEATHGRTSDAAAPDLGMLLWDLAQAEYTQESFVLAETIQRELNDLLGTRDRGVRQAPLRVLRGVTMPAVLVEVAFISNPQEEAALRTSEFKDRIAEAIVKSLGNYKRSYEDRIGLDADGKEGR
jgi:N-acetylmuramoyl-L-alanine amidase